MKDIFTLKEKLNSFDLKERHEALRRLMLISLGPEKQSDNVNMHIHSFFSFNAEGWSPTRIAWEAYEKGLYAAAIIDFDVLDGMLEFYEAGEILGIRTNVGIETRAFLKEYSDREIDSPGEPGVSYIGGSGFTKILPKTFLQSAKLAEYRQTARDRNISLIARINPHVPGIAIDYENDVLPLSPSDSATERHIVSAYLRKTETVFQDRPVLINFLSQTLGKLQEETENLLKSRTSLEEVMRAKFAKRGGFGYVQPTPATFPKVEEFFAWVKSCGAIPMESWLDGTSAGESNPKELLELSVSKGAAALNLIPDRNWNIKDPEIREKKTSNLREIIKVADSMNLPLNIGTEMNKKGQPFCDDLNGSVLKEFKGTFLRGARTLVGHSILARFADFAYLGSKAENIFGTRIADKNKFFESVGALPPVTKCIADKLRTAGEEKAYSMIYDSFRNEKWMC
ncbi:MAG TPA: hypothetical protein DET40_22150 [Lentisphaeria bacterium]|nr:MAG: hypothetical protein A2X45_04235 [Lentisphaerae bacterium GWF2_50_93]HCE46257.1 hypothetical protein [Lentisphaeria bacterium]